MRICLPTEGKNGFNETVYEHFGSAPFFTIYDSTTKSLEVIENANQHHSHGACHPLKSLAGHKVEVIITSGMGKRAVQLLNQSGLKVYLSKEKTVQQSIEKFKANQLVELTVEQACGHHGCHS